MALGVAVRVAGKRPQLQATPAPGVERVGTLPRVAAKVVHKGAEAVLREVGSVVCAPGEPTRAPLEMHKPFGVVPIFAHPTSLPRDGLVEVEHRVGDHRERGEVGVVVADEFARCVPMGAMARPHAVIELAQAVQFANAAQRYSIAGGKHHRTPL